MTLQDKISTSNEFDYDEKKFIKKAIDNHQTKRGIFALIFATIFAIIIIIGLLFGISYTYRHYNVWSMQMQGKAKLAEATQSRQIQIEQAKSEKEASIFVADAIKIVGAAAKKYPEYRNQMYIQAFADAIKDGNIKQMIYVPTEAGIPILEAGKRE